GPEALMFASTTGPFVDRQQAGIIATALSLEGEIRTLDVTSSQRAALGALSQACSSVQGGAREVLLVASENRRAMARSPGELAWGDGAVSVSVGADRELLQLVGGTVESVDFLDHYRGAGQEFDYDWEERWIRDEGLAKIVPATIARLLEQTGVTADAVAHFVLPTTIGRAAANVARRSGLAGESVVDNLAGQLGETGAAHPLLMALHALETRVKPGDHMLVCSFANGCEALLFRATEAISGSAAPQSVGAALAARQPEDNYLKYLAYNDLISIDEGKRGEAAEYQTSLSTAYRNRDMLLGLVGGRCTQCGTLQFPRTRVCVNPQCRATDTQEPYSFRDEPARVASWSADYLAFTPNPPSHYGMIDFENGGRLMTDFTDVEVGEIDVGMQVEMRFRIKSVDRARGLPRYFWKAVPLRSA
ncbi:MAG: OB-fold domain-containing protein, partial [Gammaproteobacteria bacterium]|nr:OB-fold domain-containing protein [Gammaproteobacteria bacterium]